MKTIYRTPRSILLNANHTTYLPRPVRQSKKICYGAKILFSEILYFSNKDLCFSKTNPFLCELMDLDETTIKRWIKELIRENFITVEYLSAKENGSLRKIWINSDIVVDECD